MRRLLGLFVLSGVLATLAVSAVAQDDDHHQGGHRDLARLRAATVQFHSISSVEEAGYQLGYMPPFLLDTCIAHPTAGAMGFHWFNHDKIHDTVVDPLSPEAMVYAPRQNGTLRLAAVEWVVPKALWEAEHGVGAPPPTVLGHEMHILNPALGWYVAHAWVWMHNPAGMFADWNPSVNCS
jgi:hypothetical protein